MKNPLQSVILKFYILGRNLTKKFKPQWILFREILNIVRTVNTRRYQGTWPRYSTKDPWSDTLVVYSRQVEYRLADCTLKYGFNEYFPLCLIKIMKTAKLWMLYPIMSICFFFACHFWTFAWGIGRRISPKNSQIYKKKVEKCVELFSSIFRRIFPIISQFLIQKYGAMRRIL